MNPVPQAHNLHKFSPHHIPSR